MDNSQQNGNIIKSAAGFMAAQITIFYLFWVMFFGEVIRWNLADGTLYRPLRDAFLVPFADIFITGHHWVGKIITGVILVAVVYFIAKKLKRGKSMGEAKLIKCGYMLVGAFWIYTVLTLVYFIGHMNHFWFF